MNPDKITLYQLRHLTLAAQIVKSLLDTLDRETRSMVELHVIEGYEIKELAKRFKCSNTTISTKIRKGLALLREHV